MPLTGAELKAIRESAKLNQEQFAKRIGMTREMVSMMESGKREISRGTEITVSQFVEIEKQIVTESEMSYPKAVTLLDKWKEILSIAFSPEHLSKLEQTKIAELQKTNELMKELDELLKTEDSKKNK